MKKGILLSVVWLFIGMALSVLILANPFDWHWVHLVQAKIPIQLNDSAASDAAGDRQLWTCGMHPHVIQDTPGTCPICKMTLTPLKGSTAGGEKAGTATGEKVVKYWQAPMDPTFISDKPGKSPMGMDLIPVYEGEEKEDGPGTVRIDPVFVQNIGVQSVPLERTDIPFTIRTVGTFAYNDRQLSWITTKYEGWIEKAYVNYVGEPVVKGQKLFEIYSPRLVTTQKEYVQAIEYVERLKAGQYPDIRKRARSLLASSRERLEYWDITEAQIDKLEKSGQVRRTLTVVSPVDGLVVEKMSQALEGMYVKPGMNLYQIVDLSSIWVEAEIFENQVPWLKVGQSATIETPYQPGKRYRGKVRYTYPFFNNRTRTLKVSIELPNPDGQLRSEMYANVTFEVPSARGVLAVPEAAVIHSGERNIVVLDRGDGTFQVKEVVLGVNGNGLWEVKEGLSDGDQIVISSQFLIDSESNLKEAIRKIIAERKGSPAPEQAPPSTPDQHEH